MAKDFEAKFREWWNLVYDNVISPTPSDFDYLEEIENFLETPDACLEEQRRIHKEVQQDEEDQRINDYLETQRGDDE